MTQNEIKLLIVGARQEAIVALINDDGSNPSKSPQLRGHIQAYDNLLNRIKEQEQKEQKELTAHESD